jgi:hypothetical protein
MSPNGGKNLAWLVIVLFGENDPQDAQRDTHLLQMASNEGWVMYQFLSWNRVQETRSKEAAWDKAAERTAYLMICISLGNLWA